MTSISDKLLIKAASEYVYDISLFYLYEDPVSYVREKLRDDFKDRYIIKDYQNKEFERDGKRINIRYILIEDTISLECALVYQGSDGEIISMFSGQDNDWSNNLNLAAKLDSDNYFLALEEFKYLKYELNYNITALSGNSLGGAYSLFVKEHYKDLRVIGLNPAPNILDGHFTYDKLSTNLLISSDILSRSLTLDESRIKDKDRCHLSEVYGFDPYIIKRTIPLFNEEAILLAHVGAMSNYREIIIKLFNENFLYYNTRILLQGNEKADFTKLIFKRLYSELDRKELKKFSDDNIYPILSFNDKNIVDSYMTYPGITDFIFYDLMSGNLISDTNNCKVETNKLINNLNDNNRQLMKSSDFFIKNSKYELLKVNDKPSPLYNSPKFLAEKLGFGLNVDLTYAKYFIALPQSIRQRIVSLLESNVRLFINLNSKLSKTYDIKKDVSSTMVSDYIEDLLSSLSILEEMFIELESNLALLSEYTMDLLLNNKVFTLKKSYFKEINIKDYKYNFTNLNLSLIELQDEKANKALDAVMPDINKLVSDATDSIVDLLETIENELSLDLESVENSKLYVQVKSLRANVDFKSMLSLFIKEYRDDIVAYLLKGGTAITVKYNVIQLAELIDNYKVMLKNLDDYMKRTLVKRNYQKFEKNYNIINKNISNIVEVLDLIYKRDEK